MTVLLPFIAIALLALTEFFLARAWTAAYYRYGLPLFRLRLEGLRLGPDVEGRLASVADEKASLIIHERLSEGEIAFREKGRSSPTFRYVPVFHGLIRYNAEEGSTYVIAWMNYWSLAAAGFLAWMFFEAPRFRRPWELVFWFALIFGGMILIGVLRYRQVAKALRATAVQTTAPSSPAR